MTMRLKTLVAAALATLALSAVAAAPSQAYVQWWWDTGNWRHTIAYQNWDGQWWLPPGRSFTWPQFYSQKANDCMNWYDIYTPSIVFGGDVGFYSAKIRMYDGWHPEWWQSAVTWTPDDDSYSLIQFNAQQLSDPGRAYPNTIAQWNWNHDATVTAVVCHELGHAQGLDHADQGGVMAAGYFPTWSAIPIQDEGNGINFMYRYYNYQTRWNPAH